MTVSEKLNLLQQMITEDDTLNQTLDKLLDITLAQYREKLAKYDAALRTFESQYNMRSDEFYAKFEAGALGDAMDFFEWAGIIELSRDARQKIEQMVSIE